MQLTVITPSHKDSPMRKAPGEVSRPNRNMIRGVAATAAAVTLPPELHRMRNADLLHRGKTRRPRRFRNLLKSHQETSQWK